LINLDYSFRPINSPLQVLPRSRSEQINHTPLQSATTRPLIPESNSMAGISEYRRGGYYGYYDQQAGGDHSHVAAGGGVLICLQLKLYLYNNSSVYL
jgi:hypothetical protein